MSYIGDTGLGPDFFPKVVSVILIVLSILIFISNGKDKKTEKNPNIKYTLITIGIFAVYIVLIGKIGYLVSTILFSFAIISLLKKDSIVLKVVYSIIFPVGLYLLFTYAFKVSLPTGIFI
jgi:putative tricarboxylic transport membrane protein